MRVKHVAKSLKWLIFLCSAHASFAQDINGDLNTNIGAGSNVDSNNSSETVNYNGAGSSPGSQPAATAMAPTVMGGGGSQSCLVPSSTGFQISLFGIARGEMEQDPECNRRRDAALLGQSTAIGGLGLQVSGISVLCVDNPRVFKAMALAGTPCPIMDVKTGKLLIGREAFETYRKNTDFIVGYNQDKAFWDALLLIGKDLPDVEQDDNGLSLSDRFRRNGRPNARQPIERGESDNGSGQFVDDVDSGG